MTSRRASSASWTVPLGLSAGLLTVALALSHYGPLHLLLSALGFTGAFIASMVGIGGAIIMIPALLNVPQLAGLSPLSMHTVAGIAIVQVVTASITAVLNHRRFGAVNLALVRTLGVAMVVASFAGGAASRWISPRLLEGIFASLAALAAILLLIAPGRRLDAAGPDGAGTFDSNLAIGLGTGVGLAAGLVGAGGGFLLVPLMVYTLGVPLRVAIGTSLAIVALGAIFATVGKAVTGQVDWPLAAALVIGALPGAWLGSQTSRVVSQPILARVLGCVIVVVAARMWWQLLR